MVKLLSINVRGIGNQVKRRALFQQHRFNADILIMQETHSHEDIEAIWESEWGGKAIFAHGTASARGVAVFCSKKVYMGIRNILTDEVGRSVIWDLQIDETIVTIAAIYAPNEDNPNFFKQLNEKLRNRSEHKIIIGDFNLALDVDLDRLNTYNNNNKSKEIVEGMMDEFQLKDIWRVRNGEAREYSWHKGGEIRKASRIDYALVSGGADQKVEELMYISSIKTDHRAVYMSLNLSANERGPGFWKFNCSLLQNITFVEKMNIELQKTLDASKQCDPLTRWETVKKRIKKVTKAFSREQTSEDKIIISQLSEVVNDLESRLPLNRNEDSLLLNTKTDLEEKLLEKAKGAIFRSKVRWFEEGEKSSKYFFALEKAKYNAKTCFKLVSEEGEEVSGNNEILLLQKEYYQKLYSEDEDVEFSMNNHFGVYVPEDIRKDQERQITMQNLEYAIKGMKNNKTPGYDGIPVDFYKVFWSKIKQVFYDMVIEVYAVQLLHPSAREGVLNLIPKPKKDTRYIKNLRPITLLNTDYKVIEKAIANKMLPALNEIISKDQRGFMKERRISVNIRKMLDLMHHAAEHDLEAVVLSLDFVKCFDKCSFSILHGSLDFFGFGNIVRQWTKILYDKFTVKIQNNGHFSGSIDIKKGVHQGGCCSSVYFLVIAEILALALKDNDDIEGINIRNIRHLLSQFADDMDTFSIASEKSLKAILEELDKFKRNSGFTISYEKTTMYRIGSLRHSSAQMYNITEVAWSNQDINVLGVTIAHEDILYKNYDSMPRSVSTVLNSWYNRGLSLIGKVQVVNALVASQFVYKMMVLPSIPKSVVKTLDNIIRDFIWNGKKSKVSLKILQNSKLKGGLGLVNFSMKDMSLKATWPQILVNEKEYASLVYASLKASTIWEDIWRCAIRPEDIKYLGIKNDFWFDELKAWSTFNYFREFRIENQLLWYNSRIKIGGKPILWSDMYRKGLRYIYQLFEGGALIPYDVMFERYGLNRLRYNSLVSAIDSDWKTYFSQLTTTVFLPIPPHNYDQVLQFGKRSLSAVVYSQLNEDEMLLHNKYLKWRMELGDFFCEDVGEFARKHMDIYKITNVSKYRSFQYRVLQRALVTNIHLSKWNIVQSANCTFCCEEVETAVHLLVECPIVQYLWRNVFIYIKECFSIEVSEPSTTAIILNDVHKGHPKAVNMLVLITKQFIYSQKCMGQQLAFPVLKALFKRVENIERYIAIKNGKVNLYEYKWGKVRRGRQEGESIDEFVQRYNESV